MAHQQFASCIEACNTCAAECDHCTVACLEEDNPKPLARCIALDIDCAQICRTASAYMARGSEQVAAVCALCADMCDACAEECEKHPMEHCKRCAKACRSCAEECRRMTQQMLQVTTTSASAQPAH
ncbi:MAG: four-helix bundle copper-binding protein [bacterium]|nr:four-helix bundle copper-binding protein [bacterium]